MGSPQRQPAEHAHLLLELRGAAGIDGVMAAVVGARRDLVHQELSQSTSRTSRRPARPRNPAPARAARREGGWLHAASAPGMRAGAMVTSRMPRALLVLRHRENPAIASPRGRAGQDHRDLDGRARGAPRGTQGTCFPFARGALENSARVAIVATAPFVVAEARGLEDLGPAASRRPRTPVSCAPPRSAWLPDPESREPAMKALLAEAILRARHRIAAGGRTERLLEPAKESALGRRVLELPRGHRRAGARPAPAGSPHRCSRC